MVDCANSSTFKETKEAIIEAMRSETHFKNGGKHVGVFERITNVRKLQSTFYDYIMAAEGLKVL